jgi:glycosyltransferase involved in cell wall biosynthesis
MHLILSLASIVVLPSYREGFPKVLIEAASCGRAVVTTDVPGCRDAVLPNITGLLVPKRDAKSLADAIKFLLLNPKKSNDMGLKARLLAEANFSVDSVVELHFDLYQSLVAKS